MWLLTHNRIIEGREVPPLHFLCEAPSESKMIISSEEDGRRLNQPLV